MLSILAFCVIACLQISLSTAGYSYKVEVKTGTSGGAGTDADVFIKIVGNQGTTDKRELASSGDDFENGELNTFNFDDNTDVGTPYKVQIRRTAILLGDWQLAFVRVTYNGHTYLFKYNDWIPKNTWTDIQVSCPKGFQLGSDHKCKDIDECLTKCTDPNARCQNYQGSYQCSCNSGYTLTNNDQCKDIDECLTSHGCDQNSHCANNIGSYRCICKSGFKKQGLTSCVNINECNKNPCKANTVCVDTIGSFRCDCNKGYERKDSLTCKDINECMSSAQKCDFRVSKCINHNGGYSCKCLPGYTRSSQYGCKDVDECSDGSHQCQSGISKCFNTMGDYYCKCNAGYHQGNDNKMCIKDKCGPMSTPYQSVVSPSRCTQSEDNYFGDVCTISCNKGYELELAKANTVTCGAGGRWLGAPNCQRVKCPALSAPANGKLLPSICTTVGNTYQGQCTYLCNSGYHRHGSPLRECQADKTWTGSKPTCIKSVAKPTVQCPSDIIFDLAPGQKTADVSAKWMDPAYTGDYLQVSPSFAKADYKYPAGITRITWTAKNSAGSDSCSILIMVNDKEAPKIVSCPSSPVAVATELTKVKVTWVEPTFSDNVGVAKKTSTHTSGQTFDIGSWNVYYTASDASGNRAVCKFEVVVKRKGCPLLPSPVGGSKSCNSFGQAKYCRVTCPAGQQIFNNPSQYSFWTCVSGSWSPSSKIPDCVAATKNTDGSACTGNQVIMTIKTSMSTDKYCANCPTGSYSSNGKCVLCPSGQYQDQQGSSSCKPCASGSSSDPGASDAKQCRAVCRPGHYSKDGMDPGCQLCPLDTYQDLAQATACKPCPKGTKTLNQGMTKLSECGAKPIITKLTPKTNIIDEKTDASISCYASGVPTPDIGLKFRKVFPPAFLGKEKREDIKDSNGKIIGIKLTITGATPENSGHYECTALNTFGSTTDVSSLTVNKVFGSGGGASMDEEELL